MSLIGSLRREAPVLGALGRDLAAHLRDESHVSKPSTYRLQRRMYVRSKGRSRALWSAGFRLARPVRRRSIPDTLGVLPALERDGCAVVPGFLPADRVAALRSYFEEQPGQMRGRETPPGTRVRDTNGGLRFDFSQQTFLGADGVLDIATDPRLVDLAAAYLRCKPVFTGARAYWSLSDPNADEKDFSHAAQRFHFDAEWPAFLKFFVYLTDVGEENGPLSVVAGTHRSKPIWRDGRIDEVELLDQHDLRDQERRMTGPAGTLIIADTAAFHRGVPVAGAPRLLMSFDYALTRLGNSAAKHSPQFPRSRRPDHEYAHTFDIFSTTDAEAAELTLDPSDED
jgi:hypothetical protein